MARKIERRAGIHVPHNAVRKVLRDEELAQRNPKKRRREWVMHERRHSNSMWRAGYAQLTDGRRFPAYMDGASRYITGYGIFSNAAGVREAAAKRGKPSAVPADRGARFCAE